MGDEIKKAAGRLGGLARARKAAEPKYNRCYEIALTHVAEHGTESAASIKKLVDKVIAGWTTK
jgi:hypothetical protein